MSTTLTDKYRPKSLENYFGNPGIQDAARRWLTSGDIGAHKLFYGPPGTGKTALARILKHEGVVHEKAYIELDCSREQDDDILRQIFHGYDTQPLHDGQRLFVLDEFDNMRPKSQRRMRKTMEENVERNRFILIVNHKDKVIDALQSRCAGFKFEPLTDDALRRVLDYVIAEEGMDVEDEDIELVVERADGDARNALNLLEEVMEV